MFRFILAKCSLFFSSLFKRFMSFFFVLKKTGQEVFVPPCDSFESRVLKQCFILRVKYICAYPYNFIPVLFYDLSIPSLSHLLTSFEVLKVEAKKEMISEPVPVPSLFPFVVSPKIGVFPRIDEDWFTPSLPDENPLIYSRATSPIFDPPVDLKARQRKKKRKHDLFDVPLNHVPGTLAGYRYTVPKRFRESSFASIDMTLDAAERD